MILEIVSRIIYVFTVCFVALLIKVDFYLMRTIKPHPATIRRMFQTGVWLSYKTLPHSTQIHAKLNRIQIDNQLQDSIFRVVLAPVKPPKTVINLGE